MNQFGVNVTIPFSLVLSKINADFTSQDILLAHNLSIKFNTAFGLGLLCRCLIFALSLLLVLYELLLVD